VLLHCKNLAILQYPTKRTKFSSGQSQSKHLPLILITHDNTSQNEQSISENTNLYLFIEVHQQQGSNLAHALAVTNLGVIQRVGRQYVKQRLLPTYTNQHWPLHHFSPSKHKYCQTSMLLINQQRVNLKMALSGFYPPKSGLKIGCMFPPQLSSSNPPLRAPC